MATAPDARVPVMTVLEARVSAERAQELVQIFSRSAGRRPPQMLSMYLVQGEADPTLWRAISVWRSRAALEEYRRSVTTPGGVAMLKAVGAEPVLTIWSVPVAALEPGEGEAA